MQVLRVNAGQLEDAYLDHWAADLGLVDLLSRARADAASGLLDIRRLAEMLSRIRGRIIHKPLDHVSPLAVPVMLEIGKEPVFSGDAAEAVLREAEEDLVRDAMS